MANTVILGYSDRISVAAGQTIKFMVSVEGAECYSAKIVRLVNGNADPRGPGFQEEAITTSVNREYPGRFQAIHAGSHILVDDKDGVLNSVLQLAFMPSSCPRRRRKDLSRLSPGGIQSGAKAGFFSSTIRVGWRCGSAMVRVTLSNVRHQ